MRPWERTGINLSLGLRRLNLTNILLVLTLVKDTGITVAYQDVLRGKFVDQVGDIHPLADQITDQLSPTVNMLHIG